MDTDLSLRMMANFKNTKLARRDFVKLMAGSLFSVTAPPTIWPEFQQRIEPAGPQSDYQLPDHIQRVINLVQPVGVDSAGYLNLFSSLRQMPFQGRVELLETQWNQKHFDRWYRLRPEHPWAIVLHWDGGQNYPRSLAQLVNGLNHSGNIVTGSESENSAHFGVGPAEPAIADGDISAPVSIAQLQRPWMDGTPLLASHLHHTVGTQKQRLGTPGQVLFLMQEIGIQSTLVDIHLGQRLDPNFRTLAVEITGKKFDLDYPQNLPNPQLIANLLSLVRALMLAYGIRAWDVVGHLELQGDKPDPGKLFMAYIRFVMGILALQENEVSLRRAVFGEYQSRRQLHRSATSYFEQLDQFTQQITRPDQYQAWTQHTQCQPLLTCLQEIQTDNFQVPDNNGVLF